MTESQTPESARVAELEKRLADAATEISRVQAELSQARAADPNHPQVPVPYDGHAPVVMINGQQVSAGQAVDVGALLGGFFGGMTAGTAVGAGGATAAAGANPVPIPPVVSVNGQVVSGQPVDLAALMGVDAAAQVRGALEQLGLGQLGTMFGGATGSTADGTTTGLGSVHGHQLGYASTPGEVNASGNLALKWLAALVVIGLIVLMIYLSVTG